MGDHGDRRHLLGRQRQAENLSRHADLALEVFLMETLRTELGDFAKGALRQEFGRFKEELIKSFKDLSIKDLHVDSVQGESRCANEPIKCVTPPTLSIWEPLLWTADFDWMPMPQQTKGNFSARDVLIKDPTDPLRTLSDSACYAHLAIEEPSTQLCNNDQLGVLAQEDYTVPQYHSSGAAEELNRFLVKLNDKERVLSDMIEGLAIMSRNRMKPYTDELNQVLISKTKCSTEIQLLENDAFLEGPPPVGPKRLHFVDSTWFGVACNLVVALNLATMVAQERFPDAVENFRLFDHFFLLWYTCELLAKFMYRQRALFIGRVSVVWWNWLDLSIVVCGIVDQWMMPFIKFLFGQGHSARGIPINITNLRGLRFLRLFRVVRILKLVKGFLMADLKWIDGSTFEWFLTGIITLNAIVMSLELDYEECCGMFWKDLENLFLCIYSLELSIKFKRWGCEFFCHPDQWGWNILDFVIVMSAITDLWLLPSLDMIQSSITGKPGTVDLGAYGNLLSLLQMMRLLRILRLVRLVREIRPLYRLLVGVAEALRAMVWVLVLTLIVLYAGAILFTSGVGKGYLYGGDPPEGSKTGFSTVSRSLFSLFKLMNGDIEVVNPICTTVTGQLLFIMFMVLSNWAVLAILTSVVSDNMIAASARTLQEDDEAAKAESDKATMRRLFTLFGEIDADKSGEISEIEWRTTLDDRGLRHELLDASGLSVEDLEDLFDCFALEVTPDDDEEDQEVRRVLKYRDFIENMKNESQVADKRSVLHVMKYLRNMEGRLESHLRSIERARNSARRNSV